MLSAGFVSCSSDDDNDNYSTLDSYIIGTWHSFKGTVYAEGQSKTFDIDKTGEFSSAYFEFDFRDSGTVYVRCWKQDTNGLSQWIEEVCSYYAVNDIVNVTDSGGETMSMAFDIKDKSLCIRIVTMINGTQVTTNVFLRK